MSSLIIPHVDIGMTWDLIETQLEHHSVAAAIFYSTGSCFWSHLRAASLLNGPAMLCPAGGQIVMERDWRAWLETARSNTGHYGAHGLEALLAAHHSNVRHPQTGAPYAAKSWRPYNLALDLRDAENAKQTGAPKPKIDLSRPKRPVFANPGRARR